MTAHTAEGRGNLVSTAPLATVNDAGLQNGFLTSDAEAQLAKLWEDILGSDCASVDGDFFDLRVERAAVERLVAEIKNVIGVQIDVSTLLVAPTVRKLAALLEKGIDNSCIIKLQPSGDKRPLFCIHGGGGHLLEYRQLMRAMPADRPIYGVRASNVDSAQSSVGIEDLAGRYLVAIRQVQKEGPYNLCGMSFGGLVAYELATTLAAEGQEIGLLALLDTVNPAYYRSMPTARAFQFFIDVMVARSTKYISGIVHGDAVAIGQFVRDFFARRLKSLLWKARMRLARTTGRVVPVALHENVRVFEEMSKKYSPKTFSGRLVLFRAANGWPEYRHDDALGWDHASNGRVEVIVIPGDHLSMMEMPNVLDLERHLNNFLA